MGLISLERFSRQTFSPTVCKHTPFVGLRVNQSCLTSDKREPIIVYFRSAPPNHHSLPIGIGISHPLRSGDNKENSGLENQENLAVSHNNGNVRLQCRGCIHFQRRQTQRDLGYIWEGFQPARKWLSYGRACLVGPCKQTLPPSRHIIHNLITYS